MMKKWTLGNTLKTLLVATLCVFCLTLPMQPVAVAATQNYSVAFPGVVTIPIQVSGQYTATTAAVARFKLPFAARVIGVSCSARASGGTSPTLTIDVNDDGTTILSGDVTVTAGSVSEGTISTAAVADESVVTVDLTIGGTSPTWDDITVLITVVRT